jgi:hypothetical protein
VDAIDLHNKGLDKIGFKAVWVSEATTIHLVGGLMGNLIKKTQMLLGICRPLLLDAIDLHNKGWTK